MAFVGVSILLAAIPIILVQKYVGMVSKNFTQCPYCKKIFLSGEAKFNILKLFKFW
jgi:hypothetical protein